MDQSSVSPEQLALFVLGELDPTAAASVRSHLHSSAASRQIVERISLALSTMSTDDSFAAPRESLDRARAVLSSSEIGKIGRTLDRAFEGLREVLASLVFDSAQNPAPVGFRGRASARHLTFACEGSEIDLEFVPPEREGESIWRVRGQISPPEGKNIGKIVWGRTHTPRADDAALPGPDNLAREIEVSAHGEFRVESGPGTFDLVVGIGGDKVCVSGLHVPGGPSPGNGGTPR